jgi:hypothetical protein
MTDHEVTLGELSRGQSRLEREQSNIRKEFISRGEYELAQKHNTQRFDESGKVHTELKADLAAVEATALAEIRLVNDKTEAKIEAANVRLDTYEKTQRENRSKWTLAMVSSGAAFVLSIIAGLILAAVR